jgi:hypothetical protein
LSVLPLLEERQECKCGPIRADCVDLIGISETLLGNVIKQRFNEILGSWFGRTLNIGSHELSGEYSSIVEERGDTVWFERGDMGCNT